METWRWLYNHHLSKLTIPARHLAHLTHLPSLSLVLAYFQFNSMQCNWAALHLSLGGVCLGRPVLMAVEDTLSEKASCANKKVIDMHKTHNAQCLPWQNTLTSIAHLPIMCLLPLLKWSSVTAVLSPELCCPLPRVHIEGCSHPCSFKAKPTSLISKFPQTFIHTKNVNMKKTTTVNWSYLLIAGQAWLQINAVSTKDNRTGGCLLFIAASSNYTQKHAI